MGEAVPGLVVLDSVRKQAEQTMGSKPVSSTLHGLCISSCLQVPALLEFLPHLFWIMNCYMEVFPKLFLVVVLYHSGSNSV